MNTHPRRASYSVSRLRVALPPIWLAYSAVTMALVILLSLRLSYSSRRESRISEELEAVYSVYKDSNGESVETYLDLGNISGLTAPLPQNGHCKGVVPCQLGSGGVLCRCGDFLCIVNGTGWSCELFSSGRELLAPDGKIEAHYEGKYTDDPFTTTVSVKRSDWGSNDAEG